MSYSSFFGLFDPKTGDVPAYEPLRLSRRLVGVSHAALAYSVICE